MSSDCIVINLSMQTHRYADDVKRKKEQYEHFNIVPLYAVGAKPAIMELPEVVSRIYSSNYVELIKCSLQLSAFSFENYRLKLHLLLCGMYETLTCPMSVRLLLFLTDLSMTYLIGFLPNLGFR